MGDRYTITERLDSGGMAEVFRGVAESIQGFKKAVAIKRILPSLTENPKFVSMFLDEAKLSLYLQHANIVQVFDIGQSDDAYFLVMEYVNGCNLKHLTERLQQRNRRIDVAHAIYIVLECCKALNYAHSCENPETGDSLGIVHRDISPPNILLSKMGEVKLVDFGLAKANSQIESTDPGVVKGKFSYLSPEAASGLEVDKRADIFAVGILLWEMFTGRRLFYGDTDYQTVELVRQARIPSIAALNSEIEPELEAIVRRALERDPRDRFDEAADLGEALAQFLFSRRMKVTARDIAGLVQDAANTQERKRSKDSKGSHIGKLILDEMGAINSLVDTDSPAMVAIGAQSLSPNEFSGGSSWGDSAYDDFDNHGNNHGNNNGNNNSRGNSTPSADSADTRRGYGNATNARSAQNDIAMIHSRRPVETTTDNELESLQQMLEPEGTGVHDRSPESRGVMIALIVAVLLAGAIGVGIFVFKDRLFGAPTQQRLPQDVPNQIQPSR